MQVKTIIAYCCHPAEWLNLERLTISRVGKEVELLEFSGIASGSVKWYTTLENFLTVSESQMYAYPMTQQFQENICLQKDLSIIVLESLSLIVPNRKQSECLLADECVN